MNNTILKIENLSKQYRLGIVGTGTLSHDLNRWWHKIRGKGDPYLKIGEVNDRATSSNSEYVWALKDISFDVAKGEVLGIIGKNGAGKSTLLKLLSRVTGPTTGSIKSKGRIASLLEVGTGFHPELTGRENIYINGAILGMSKAEITSKIDEIVTFSGCERYIDTPTKRYSSGMTVRLAFAVAAHLEPDILIVDEVLAVGDAEFQKKAIGKMQDISNSDGRTVLFVSHNMAAVKSLCTRGIVLENGESVFEGTSTEAVDFYLSTGQNYKIENLINRIDRSGNGAITFKELSIFNEQETEVNEVITGTPANFKISFNRNRELEDKDFVFGLVIYDNKEQKVADFYSDEMGIVFDTIVDNTVYLKLDRLMLRAGEYNVAIVAQSLKMRATAFDRIFNALSFTVMTTDYYKKNTFIRATNVALLDGKFSS